MCGVVEDVVVLACEACGGGAAEAVAPDEVVDEVVWREEFVEEESDVVGGSPVDVDEDGGGGLECGECCGDAIAEPIDPGGGRWPGVGVGACVCGFALAGVEGWVCVEEIDGVWGERWRQRQPVAGAEVGGHVVETISLLEGCLHFLGWRHCSWLWCGDPPRDPAANTRRRPQRRQRVLDDRWRRDKVFHVSGFGLRGLRY